MDIEFNNTSTIWICWIDKVGMDVISPVVNRDPWRDLRCRKPLETLNAIWSINTNQFMMVTVT